MRVRDWQDILADVVESDAEPTGWRAIGGQRTRGIGEDLYIAHPSGGAYLLKTYAKNPFQVEGVGARIDSGLDADLEALFPDEEDGTGLFGVRQPAEDEDDARNRVKTLESVLETHADAPTTPNALFEDIMHALDSPAYGPMEFTHTDRPERLDELNDTFADAEEALEASFEDVVDETVQRGFH